MAAASIYLDNNATTPIDPRVVQAMNRAREQCPGNPASQHHAGRQARRLLEEAREGILQLLGANTTGLEADQLIFTSGGTEANNLALLGLCASSAGTKPGPGESPSVVVSSIEHPSIVAAALELGRRGITVESLTANSDGLVQRTTRHSPLTTHSVGDSSSSVILSVMLANNETGVIQPIAEIASGCHARGILLHTDAVQAVGKIPVSFRDLGVDAMTVAPHKFHGPLGIGALLLRHGVNLHPQLFGGFQQGGLRPGTESVALAVGFYEALRLAHDEATDRQTRMCSLRDELERLLQAELPDIVVIGQRAPRLPNTSCIAFPGLNRQALAMALDMAGVACSTGSACASGSSEPSPTLLAMGLEKALIEGALRFSLGAFTTAAEINEAARRIIHSVKHLRSQK